jgi:hypothetical protein
MSIPVPGVGDVPVIWRAAVLGADASFGRGGKHVIAIVHHRMVGTLAGTIPTFTAGNRNRPVSTHFGIGYLSGKLTICQFVDLRDTAFGNGNFDPSGRWDDFGYSTVGINAQTISIEHEDGATAGRGVVKDPIIRASIELDRLLLSGNLTRIRAAGIRCSSSTVATDLGRIKPSTRTMLRHWDIAGRLKPFCWLRWLDDPGMPQSRYISELTGAPAPAPVPGGSDVDSFAVPKAPTLAVVRTGAWLYVSSALTPNAGNVQISPGRKLPYFGIAPGGSRIVEYVGSTGVHSGKAYFVKSEDVTAYEAVPSGGATQAQIDAAALAGRRAEWDRQTVRPKAAITAEGPLLTRP